MMMQANKKNKYSFLAFTFLAICLIFGRFLLPRFETHDVLSILTWDVFGYYLYLPAYFIHHDIGLWHFEWVRHILDTYNPTIGFYQAYQGPLGDYVMKYPGGMAILYTPLFFIGHLWAWMGNYPMDGFSLPYQVSIAVGSVFYAFIGLWFLRKILLYYFPDGIAAVTMLLIVLGTNYFQLSVYDCAMPHNYLFILYTLIVWFTIKWHEKPRWSYAVLLGLSMGMATLVRPSEAICVLIPILWNIWNKESFREKWNLIRKNILQVAGVAICFLAVVMIQLVYWKIQTGKFIYYSYDPNERMRFIAPYLLNVLFSYKKGWFVYAPLMVFPMIGFLFIYKKYKKLFLPLAVFFVVNLIIISSWPTWWYGGSIGQRALMQSYVVLSLPFGAFLQWLSRRKPGLKILLSLVFLACIILNLFQTWQYMGFIFDPSRMTKKYYWAVFMKTHVDDKAKRYLEPEENNTREFLPGDKLYLNRQLVSFDFEKPDPSYNEGRVPDPLNTGKFAYRLTKDNSYSLGLRLPYRRVAVRDDEVWLRASVRILFHGDPKSVLGNLVISCNHKGRNWKYRSLVLEDMNLKPDEWNFITMDYLCPYVQSTNDEVQVYVWYRGDKELLIDDMKVELFEPVK